MKSMSKKQYICRWISNIYLTAVAFYQLKLDLFIIMETREIDQLCKHKQLQNDIFSRKTTTEIFLIIFYSTPLNTKYIKVLSYLFQLSTISIQTNSNTYTLSNMFLLFSLKQFVFGIIIYMRN